MLLCGLGETHDRKASLRYHPVAWVVLRRSRAVGDFDALQGGPTGAVVAAPALSGFYCRRRVDDEGLDSSAKLGGS